MMAGIELGDGEGAPLPPEERTGAKVCLAAREHGLLTRPINDTLVLMPPLCVSEADLRLAVEALRRGTETVIPV
jgi:adenosylmethionine-8-amino-7-oxononanoate aminotransferase